MDIRQLEENQQQLSSASLYSSEVQETKRLYFESSSNKINEKYYKHLEVKKIIAKIEKSKSKKFTKKQMYIIPIERQLIQRREVFMLFGFLEIEGIYRDLDEIETGYISDAQNAVLSIDKVVTKTDKGRAFTMYTNSSVDSGIKEFQFLIDHFCNNFNPKYTEIGQLLRIYQQQCKEQDAHLKELKYKLESRIIGEDEIQAAFTTFKLYVQEYITTAFTENDFYGYDIILVNPESQDYQLHSITISLPYLSLMGFDQSMQSMLEIFNSEVLSILIGENRIKNAFNQLLLSTSQKSSVYCEQVILTTDSIKMSIGMEFKLIEWPHRPDWMSKRDAYIITAEVFIDLNQIRAIIELRKGQKLEKNKNQALELQKQLRSEIFIEKFYPEKNQIQRQNEQLLN